MTPWVIWVVGLVAIFAEGGALGALGVESWALQLPIVLTAYVGLRRDFHSSAWIALGWMIPAEWCAVAPAGLYALGLAVVFFAMRIVAARFDAKWNLIKVGLTALGVLLHHLTLAGWLGVTVRDGGGALSGAILATSFTAALLGAAASVPLGAALGRLERIFAPQRGGDEMFL